MSDSGDRLKVDECLFEAIVDPVARKVTLIDVRLYDKERARAEAAEAKLASNLCDVIAAERGWPPLVIGESMTIGFADGTDYEIKRNKDRDWVKKK